MNIYQQFKSFPRIFQYQFYTHIFCVTILILVTIVFCFLRLGMIMLFPPIILFCFLFVHGIWLFQTVAKQKYIRIDGNCIGVIQTPLWKRHKYVQINVNGTLVQIALKHSRTSYQPHQHLCLYLSSQTPVYESQGGYTIYNYLAIEPVLFTQNN